MQAGNLGRAFAFTPAGARLPESLWHEGGARLSRKFTDLRAYRLTYENGLTDRARVSGLPGGAGFAFHLREV